MAKKIIDPQLAEALRANPNVEKVTRKSIVFKASFINRALDQYLLGGKPRIEIFEEAGIDVEAVGRERLAMAFGNWLTKVKRGQPLGRPPGRHPDPGAGDAEALRKENQRLLAIVELYRQLARLDRRHQPQKQPPGDTKP